LNSSDLGGDGCGHLIKDHIVVHDDGAGAEGLYLHPVEGGRQGRVLVQRRQLMTYYVLCFLIRQ
jgi:hypothetical protein